MKPKNIMLLGFINSAVDYLEKHMNDENSKLDDLRNTDLYNLRDELAGSLDVILGTKQSTLSTLMKVGNEAFDDFMNPESQKMSLAERFDKTLENQYKGLGKIDKKDLANLMSLYDLEGMDDNDSNSEDSFERQIKNNAMNNQKNTRNDYESLDNVFNEIVNNEKNNVQNNQPIEEIPQDNSIKVDPYANSNFNDLVNELRQQMIREDQLINQNNQVKQVYNNNTSNNSVNNVDYQMNNQNMPTSSYDNNSFDQNDLVENYFNDNSNKLDNNNIYQNTQPINQNNIIEQVDDALRKQYNDQNNVASNEYIPSTPQPSRFNSLIDDYIDKQIKEEEKQKAEKEKKEAEVCARIGKIYTYLKPEQIKVIYSLKDELNNEYPLDKKIIVLHRVRFEDVENLRQFVEIGLKHGYTINADEKKLIVDIFKQFVNADGKILNNIYEIANQGNILEGKYEGYNVIEVFDDDDNIQQEEVEE